MSARGLPRYEISNHAKLGQESRHNLAYWRGEEYIGIGPGAHGRLNIDGARIATETVNMAWDPEDPSANANGTILEAVTKDQLNTGLTGQIRYRVSERNLYAYLFGVKRPIAHVMGYFVSVLRERIANFEAPPSTKVPEAGSGGLDIASVAGISINDIRKNLRDFWNLTP